ncbi:uracil-xanthine permease [Mycobacterium frederiksbergense]|uniref:Uracil-xanthine permease n=1 Tax=Mycolicibacterium frederiksbergense TaxID=117567 RepID=A0ABT6KXZ3_9MYCO|nr:uracil-xanthine permease family protein [Mycolicibacterium frederiksbergense]MDH6195579.1 uracil-xanthine permease [Mycolicibacterium frederiksbergense]
MLEEPPVGDVGHQGRGGRGPDAGEGRMTQPKPALAFLYNLEDRLPIGRGVLYGMQHVIIMLPPTALAPVLLSGGLHLSPSLTISIVAATLVAAGLATLLQGNGAFGIGARLPVVQGTELYFLPPLIAIGLISGTGSIAFCVMLGGVLVCLISFFYRHIEKLFPPVVVGTIITLIGVALIPIGIEQFVGHGTPYFGTGKAFLVASVTFVCMLAFSIVLRGFLRSIAIVLAIVIGYALSVALGIVDFGPIKEAAWFGLPHLLPLGFDVPSLTEIVLIMLLFVVAAVETTGYVSATSTLVGVEPSRKRISSGLIADGIGSVVSGALGSTPMTAYAQNLGALSMTRVAARRISVFAGGILILLGLVPKFGAVLGTIPTPVLGGVALLLFGTVAGVGIKTLRPTLHTERSTVIIAASLSLGVGFALVPGEGIAFMSTNIALALQTGVAVGGLAAVILNLMIPEERTSPPPGDTAEVVTGH